MERRKSALNHVWVFIIGILSGAVVGGLIGVNLASWEYAGIVASGYVELMTTEQGQLFVSKNGCLHQLVPVKNVTQIELMAVPDKFIGADTKK